MISLRSTLPTSMGMIDRVFRHPSGDGPAPQPAYPPCFPKGDIFLLKISHLSNRGPALRQHVAKLSGRQFYEGVSPLFGHELCSGTSAAYELPAFSDLEFYVMDDSAHGYELKRK